MSILRSSAKLVFAGADRLLPRPTGPRLLIYHQIGAGLGRQMEVGVADFEWHLDRLQAEWEVATLDEALRRWNDPAADRLVVLTFDDGYLDTWTTAFPRLLEFGLPFTLYLATHSIESGEPLGPAGAADPLTWDQVGEMVDSGLVTVGAHTHTHVDLTRLASEPILEEVSMSDDLIEQRLGVRPRHFAYPWGHWSATAESVLAERYESAVVGGFVKAPSRLHPMRVRRYPIQLSDGTRHFRARLRGGLRAEEALRRRIRGYRGP